MRYKILQTQALKHSQLGGNLGKMRQNYKSNWLLPSLLWALLSLGACQGSVSENPNPSPPPTDSTVGTSPPASPEPGSEPIAATETETQEDVGRSQESAKTVKVYFPTTNVPEGELAAVEAVEREFEGQQEARFAIAQLIAGPTEEEKDRGLSAPIKLAGEPTCASDFLLSIYKGVARLKFCQGIVVAGIGDVARVQSAIDATLTQFDNIDKVAVLNPDGECFGELSGENTCLSLLEGYPELTEESKVAVDGIGPIGVGMTLKEASAAAGLALVDGGVNAGDEGNAECFYYEPENGPVGVSFMVINNRIARVDIDNPRVTTISGAKIGDSSDRIQGLYPELIEVGNHKYVPEGKYLTLVPKLPQNQNYRLIFETDASDRVTRFRAGKLPEIEYVEGCS